MNSLDLEILKDINAKLERIEAALATLSGNGANTAEDGLLNENQTAKLLGIRPQTAALWRVQKRGPAWVKMGRRIRYRRADIDTYIEDRKQEQSA
jgi:predicted DNA-binding transcriptional regulator AlpA